jgi:hypothetical protein
MVNSGNSYKRGRLSMVDLLVPTSLFLVSIFNNNLYFYSYKKEAILMRRSTVLSLPLQLMFPCTFNTAKNFYENGAGL